MKYHNKPVKILIKTDNFKNKPVKILKNIKINRYRKT